MKTADLPNELLNNKSFELTDNELEEKTTSGTRLFFNRVNWGKAYLKQGKFLEQPERGLVKIGNKGIELLKSGKKITLDILRQDPDFIAHKESITALKNKEEVVESESTPQDMIDAGFNAIKAQVKNELLEKLKTIDPYYFEKVVLQLLNKMGYGDFLETSKSGDGGIDGVINQDQLGLEKIFVQAKRYNENKVREKEIRNFIGAMSGDTSKGIFVTTSSFDDSAIQKTREAHHKIILVDGRKLVDLMHKFSVGVQIKANYEVKEIDEDFFEEKG